MAKDAFLEELIVRSTGDAKMQSTASNDFVSLLEHIVDLSEQMDQMAQVKLKQLCVNRPGPEVEPGLPAQKEERSLPEYFELTTSKARLIKKNIVSTLEILKKVEF